MKHAVLDRDVEALAHRIERSGRTRPVLARQHERVDKALFRQLRPAEAAQFGIQEAAVEFGIVRDDRIITEEFHQRIAHAGMLERHLIVQNFVGDAGDANGRFGNRAPGIDVDLEFAARRQIVYQLDAADLYDAVGLLGIGVVGVEPGGFCIEDDFPHVSSCSVANRIRVRSVSMISSICASA